MTKTQGAARADGVGGAGGPGPADMVHRGTFRLNSWLFVAFMALSVVLWLGMPERYPVHFDLAGNPTRWAEDGPGMWILLVSLAALSFGKMHLFQRFLITDPDSQLLNLPHKERFRALPRGRKVPVLRRANRMLGLMNTALLLTYIAVLLLVYHGAHNPASASAALASRAVLVLVMMMIALPITELVGLRRMIRRKLEEEGL